jgi:hypothetical protein
MTLASFAVMFANTISGKSFVIRYSKNDKPTNCPENNINMNILINMDLITAM